MACSGCRRGGLSAARISRPTSGSRRSPPTSSSPPTTPAAIRRPAAAAAAPRRPGALPPLPGRLPESSPSGPPPRAADRFVGATSPYRCRSTSCSGAPASPGREHASVGPAVVRAQRQARAADPGDVVAPSTSSSPTGRPATGPPGGSGSPPSSASACSWRASRSRCTAASTSPSRSGSPWPGGGRRWSWRSPAPGGTGDGGPDSGHPPDDEPPVRAALGRLLGLVSRHRPHGSAGWSASAS